MANENVQIRSEWNTLAVLFSLFGAIVLQGILLPSLCYQGTVNMYIAGAVDAVVAIRLIIARVFKERGRGWIFYSALPYVIIGVLLALEHFGAHR